MWARRGRKSSLAAAIAYEVQCRFCDAASIRARGWDHPTYGAFSTALACAKLMKLDAERTRHAINIAGVNCAAFRQARVGELSHWKGVAFANAARYGVYAAMLARAGMTGPAPIFEGQMGFEKELGVSIGDVGRLIREEGGGDAGRGAGVDDSEDEHQVLAGGISQPKRDRGGAFFAEANRRLSQVKSMVIESHDASVDIIGSEPEKWRPQQRETADHSLPYITAVALIDGEVTDKQFAPERFTRRASWSFCRT